MESILQLLLDHGYLVLFVWVAGEQAGLPIPAVPALLAAGALAGAGRMSLPLSLGAGVAASLASDLLWYEIGRRRGIRVLHLLCWISLEPGSCVRQTEELFSRRGALALLLAKFIPGLSTVAPPLAGIARMPPGRFLLLDGLGALLWVGLFIGLGVLFDTQLEGLAALLAAMGSWLLALLAGALGAYLAGKFALRRRALRRLRLARITPEELDRKLRGGEEVVIVDLRHPLEIDADPVVIPGAIRFGAPDLDGLRHAIPPDREVILYCS